MTKIAQINANCIDIVGPLHFIDKPLNLDFIIFSKENVFEQLYHEENLSSETETSKTSEMYGIDVEDRNLERLVKSRNYFSR